METPELTFTSLEERIEASSKDRSDPSESNPRAKWGFGMVAVSGLLGLLLGKTLPPSPLLVVLLAALLVVEIAGLILGVSATLPEIPKLTLRHQRREFASILDSDMPDNEGLIVWLRTFPRDRLQAMSDYATFRLERYRSKMPAFTGSIDKLGALPVLAAIVIQFKDVSWPPQVSWWQILLFGLLAFFYWLSLLAINQRVRLELYDSLLKKALA